MMQRRRVACFAALLVLTGCIGTDVGNPPDTRRTALQFEAVEGEAGGEEVGGHEASTSNQASNDVDEANPRGLILQNGMEIDEIWLAVRAVHFRPAADCANDGSQDVVADGPFAVDLLDRDTLPRSPEVDDEAAAWCAIELELDTAEPLPEGASERLRGNVLYLAGTREDGVAFELYDDRSFTIEYRAEDPIELAEDNILFGSFAIAGWIDRNALGQLQGDPAVGSSTTTPALLNTLRAQMRKSSHISVDTNRDRALDASERSEHAAEAVIP